MAIIHAIVAVGANVIVERYIDTARHINLLRILHLSLRRLSMEKAGCDGHQSDTIE